MGNNKTLPHMNCLHVQWCYKTGLPNMPGLLNAASWRSCCCCYPVGEVVAAVSLILHRRLDIWLNQWAPTIVNLVGLLRVLAKCGSFISYSRVEMRHNQLIIWNGKWLALNLIDWLQSPGEWQVAVVRLTTFPMPYRVVVRRDLARLPLGHYLAFLHVLLIWGWDFTWTINSRWFDIIIIIIRNGAESFCLLPTHAIYCLLIDDITGQCPLRMQCCTVPLKGAGGLAFDPEWVWSSSSSSSSSIQCIIWVCQGKAN